MVPFHFSTLLLTVSPSAMRTAQRAARPLLTHSFGYAHCSTRCPTLVDSFLRLCLLIVHAASRSFHSSDRPLLFLPDTLTYPSRCLAQLPCSSLSARLTTAFDSVQLVTYCRVYKTPRSCMYFLSLTSSSIQAFTRHLSALRLCSRLVVFYLLVEPSLCSASPLRLLRLHHSSSPIDDSVD